jgi:hypothetical protein
MCVGLFVELTHGESVKAGKKKSYSGLVFKNILDIYKCAANGMVINKQIWLAEHAITFGYGRHIPGCLLTPWSRGVPEKLTSPQPVRKFPAISRIGRFITAFTKARD